MHNTQPHVDDGSGLVAKKAVGAWPAAKPWVNRQLCARLPRWSPIICSGGLTEYWMKLGFNLGGLRLHYVHRTRALARGQIAKALNDQIWWCLSDCRVNRNFGRPRASQVSRQLAGRRRVGSGLAHWRQYADELD